MDKQRIKNKVDLKKIPVSEALQILQAKRADLFNEKTK